MKPFLNAKKPEVDSKIYYAWSATEPCVVYNLDRHEQYNTEIWSVAYMKKHFSNEKSSLVDCRENEVTTKRPLRSFWDGFEDYEKRFGDDELPYIYKLKGNARYQYDFIA